MVRLLLTYLHQQLVVGDLGPIMVMVLELGAVMVNRLGTFVDLGPELGLGSGLGMGTVVGLGTQLGTELGTRLGT